MRIVFPDDSKLCIESGFSAIINGKNRLLAYRKGDENPLKKGWHWVRSDCKIGKKDMFFK